MSIATSVIEFRLKSWIDKKESTLLRIEELLKEGKNIEAQALGLVLDTIEEVIFDLSEMIDSLNNIASYEESCFNLINKITKK